MAVSITFVDGATVIPANWLNYVNTIVNTAAGVGTVTSASVVSANGFAGTVATATTTPAITISTSITGLLKGNGTAISAATLNTDYISAASTSTLTEKTFDTAGSGNSFSINGVAVTANTGTGAVARATSPTFVTPTLGVATATTINKVTFTAPASGSTLTIADGKTATVSNTLTLAGTDGTVMTFPGQTASVGYLNIPQNSKSAAYTTVALDAGGHIFHPSADTSARTWTIDSNANVPYAIGTALTFINQNSAGVITIAITSDTMRLAGAGTTGSRTLAANGVATAIKVTSTEWIISGTGLT